MRYKSDGKTTKNGGNEKVGRNTPLHAVDDEKSFPTIEVGVYLQIILGLKICYLIEFFY